MIEKSAGILGTVAKTGLNIGKAAIKHPFKTLGVATGVTGAVGAAKKGLNSQPIAPQPKQKFTGQPIYRTANEILNGIDKKAKENNDKKDIKKDIATGAIGAKMLHSSKDKILGQKTLYHGTSSKNWENIKKEGLRSNHGGTGGAGDAIKSELYKNDSKGKVHATAKKWKADMYARIGESSDKVNKTPEAKKYTKLRNEFTDKNGEITFNGTKDEIKKQLDAFSKARKDFTKVQFKEMAKNKGKVAKVKMDYNKYKKMEIDPYEQGKVFGNLAKKVKNKGAKEVLNNMGKDFAARGDINITPNEIVGLHNSAKRLTKTVKNIPHYAKTNKGRFGTGLALAGAGGVLVNKSVKDIKNKIRDDAKTKLN